MKNSKFIYYFSNTIIKLVPNFIFKIRLDYLLNKKSYLGDEYIDYRVNYYNKLSKNFSVDKDGFQINRFKRTGGWTYFFDTYSIVKYFNGKLKFKLLSGDIQYIPNSPSFVKSRPIVDNDDNAVILKLNKVRHFNFIKDPYDYRDKLDMAVWRGIGKKEHRKVVIRQFYNNPKCNIGQTKPIENEPWVKEYLSIKEQLKYKFLVCIEGNDVATNLKWAMSSNSLVMMSKPKFETWFMEGRLEPNVHFVLLKDDYSDLIEKMDYYLSHEQEALMIINNAHHWCEQFKDKKRELIISLLVVKKYFNLSNQM